jgi:MoaA/NifB/PqqE/SkfB family radical SAM enzyme
MTLTGIHLLLSYQCTLECDHCFVWGSPWQTGTMSLTNVRRLLDQAEALGTVEWIYFEGGEPMLFYPVLVAGAQDAARRGFQVGVVTNAYWATEVDDAVAWLRPFAGIVGDLSLSSDALHGQAAADRQVRFAREAAERLGIPVGTISVASPEVTDAASSVGQLPTGECGVMYRGRAVEKLADKVAGHHWEDFERCPYENLRDPGRLHIDPLGYVAICQGIALGNAFETPLADLWASYEPENHPIVGPLLRGGPAELVRQYALPHQDTYADACHLCDAARRQLRSRFPDVLAPDQMYGVVEQG